MAYTTEEARGQILHDLGGGIDQLAAALASLSEAYEVLDEDSGDQLEGWMFRPVQAAFGRAQRTYTEFARRHGLPGRTFEPASAGQLAHDPKLYIERAIEAIEAADHQIAELQDSMLPVDVGDTELRAGLSETRSLVAQAPAGGRRLLRTFGR